MDNKKCDFLLENISPDIFLDIDFKNDIRLNDTQSKKPEKMKYLLRFG